MTDSTAFHQLEAIAESIKKGSIKSVYTVMGDDEFLVNQAQKLLVDSLLKYRKTGTVSVLENKQATLSDLLNELKSPSLFDPFRIVIVNNISLPGKDDPHVREFIAWLEHNQENSRQLPVLPLLVTGKIDRRSKLGKLLKNLGVVLSFDIPSEYIKGNISKDPYYGFIRSRLKEVSKKISTSAWQELRQRTPNNLWSVWNAVEVLIAFTDDAAIIDIEHVREAVPMGEEIPVFKITDAIGEKKPAKLLNELRNLLEQGHHPLLINKVLSKRLRMFLAAKDLYAFPAMKSFNENTAYMFFKNSIYPVLKDELKGDTLLNAFFGGMHPYALHQILNQSSTVGIPEVRSCLVKLAEIDMALKSTTKSPEILFEMALLPICV